MYALIQPSNARVRKRHQLSHPAQNALVSTLASIRTQRFGGNDDGAKVIHAFLDLHLKATAFPFFVFAVDLHITQRTGFVISAEDQFFSGWQAFDDQITVLIAGSREWVIEYDDVRFHPGVNVAVDRESARVRLSPVRPTFPGQRGS